ncbi:liver-expressed antimicrobial peptide 2 [Chelydra serpentina]|uniref:Liver-expressed antimicrobial peptide 2 n=1 Tax=Chelydra serpentina TaxID=8475 RepID=A0A8T1TKY6_CHESE|nr:liver-expressed antimicrobial peptide 2 [Chelydra serpentina]
MTPFWRGISLRPIGVICRDDSECASRLCRKNRCSLRISVHDPSVRRRKYCYLLQCSTLYIKYLLTLFKLGHFELCNCIYLIFFRKKGLYEMM